MPGFDPVFELSSLNGADGFQISGDPFDQSGVSVASAGDVNGDGFDDLIVGAPRALRDYGNYGSSSGASYVVFGQAGGFAAEIDLSSLNGTNGFQISGDAAGDYSGSSVASAGDVNGDGFDDLIVGAPRALRSSYGYGYYGSSSGASYVVFGQAGGFAAEIDLSSLNGTNGFQISGDAAGDYSGSSVASAGDVNGDGFDDLIVGAPRALRSSYGYGYYGSSSGASYVVFGQAGGFAAEIDLSSLNGTNGFQISGDAAGDYSGSSVASAGDVNGDGFDDLIVGAPRALRSSYGYGYYGSSSGASYVVFGQAGGFAAEIDLSSLNGTNGFQISGDAAGDYSGSSVASAGDVNGDGFDDLIVGAPSADPNGFASGASYVVFGQAGGFAAEIDLSNLNGTNGFQISGEVIFDQSGFSVASAGDVNGDGFDDLIVGAFGADSNGYSSGASYVVFGQAGGFAAEIDLFDLDDGTNGFQISGEAAGDFSGISVASAGDVNGDGFDDLIVGAIGADPNGTYSGASYVIFGQATTPLILVGTDLADHLVGGDFADTLDGRGGADTMEGQAGDDTYVVDNAGDTTTEAADGGTDTVQSSVTVTLAAEIENLLLTGSGAINGTGNDLANTIVGNSANNVLDGGLGADAMTGGLGDDTYVVDDAGDTTVEAVGGGTDTIQSSLTTTLAAEIENLTLTGSAAVNGTGTEAANALTGNIAANTLEGLGGNDALAGGDGDDTLDGGTGADTLDGGGGIDTADYSYRTGSITVTLTGSGDGTAQVGSVTETLTGIENLIGGSGGDTLTGDAAANVLNGGDGNDVLNGGNGDDTLIGGGGIDTADYSYRTGAVTVTLTGSGDGTAQVGSVTETLTGIENLTGGSGDDTLTGDAAANVLNGGDGNDVLNGGNGDDTLNGGGGIDTADYSYRTGAITVTLTGSGDGTAQIGSVTETLTGIENLTGGSGGDALTGDGGDNVLNGGDGNDVLNGGTGDDTLIGGEGIDTFALGDSDGADLVADFQNGNDLIDLSAVDDVSRFSDLDITDTGSGVLIDYGNGTIELDDVASATSIDQGDFIFT